MFLSILIVFYNCEPSKSNTFMSLLDCNGGNQSIPLNTHISLWNNGPKLWSDEIIVSLENVGFEIIQDINNAPLGRVYNKFVNKNPSRRYVFLDHDTILNETIWNVFLDDEVLIKIGTPIISCNGLNHFPVCRGKFAQGPFQPSDKVYSIGSGLVIGYEIISKFNLEFGNLFDSRYALYGVDTTFFIRIHQLKLASDLYVLPKLHHSLSRLEDEDSITKSFREKERSLEIGITLRHYFSVGRLYGALRTGLTPLFTFRFRVFYYIFLGYYYGIHPRSKVNDTDDTD
jgi:hypothetical protein